MVDDTNQSGMIHRLSGQFGCGEPDFGQFVVLAIPMHSISNSRTIIGSETVLGNLDRIIIPNILSDRGNPSFPDGRRLSTCTTNRIKLVACAKPRAQVSLICLFLRLQAGCAESTPILESTDQSGRLPTIQARMKKQSRTIATLRVDPGEPRKLAPVNR